MLGLFYNYFGIVYSWIVSFSDDSTSARLDPYIKISDQPMLINPGAAYVPVVREYYNSIKMHLPCKVTAPTIQSNQPFRLCLLSSSPSKWVLTLY